MSLWRMFTVDGFSRYFVNAKKTHKYELMGFYYFEKTITIDVSLKGFILRLNSNA